MTAYAGIAYLLFAFSPALAIFHKVIASDPLRIILFVLGGLSRMAASGMHISGVHTLHHARHILAVVCGLGMGVMAALFLVINVIADFWGDGTVGLPATIPEVAEQFDVKLFAKDEKFPSFWNRSGFTTQTAVLCAQLFILVVNAVYSCRVVGFTWQMAKQMPSTAMKHIYALLTCKKDCRRNNAESTPGNNINNSRRTRNTENREPHAVNT
ncbi:Gamma-secretase subunit aph-1 [Toxocara canis]|uniref:Gamma-secretase subunit aph-1 n=1 Tax=Toxocara canis TaxID=6265 RepID=A0A0B2VB03_TOXCA|nr:Gamma-secretase subunit aph-1 [Toxocara canis]